MSDIIDTANDYAEVLTEAARQYRKPEGPKATGFCLNCEEVVAEGKRWCDAQCRDDYERRVR